MASGFYRIFDGRSDGRTDGRTDGPLCLIVCAICNLTFSYLLHNDVPHFVSSFPRSHTAAAEQRSGRGEEQCEPSLQIE